MYDQLIKEIFEEEGINYKYISDDYITVLFKNGKYNYLNRYHMGLNNQITGIICDDKYAMYSILKYHNVPVIEYDLIWSKNNHKNEIEINNKINYLSNYFRNHNNHIVLKPNMGYSGLMVFNINDINIIKDTFLKLLDYTDTIVANPFYHLKYEYRVIILNGEVRLLYRKELKDGWQFNLSKGSIASKVDDLELKRKLETLAFKVYNLINAKFVSIDIVEELNGNLSILEVNSGVAISKYLDQHMEDYNLVKEIYRDAIRCLFN